MLDRLTKLFDGYERVPNKKPKHISPADWTLVVEHRAAIQKRLSPTYHTHHIRLPERVLNGLKRLQQETGLRSYGKVIAWLVEEALR